MVDAANIKKRITAASKRTSHKVCCDCPERKPTYASFIQPPSGAAMGSKPLGAVICSECATAHRTLGPDVSVVFHLTNDEWAEADILALERGGNTIVNKIYEDSLKDSSVRPLEGAHTATRGRFLRQKYEDLAFYSSTAYAKYVEQDVVKSPSVRTRKGVLGLLKKGSGAHEQSPRATSEISCEESLTATTQVSESESLGLTSEVVSSVPSRPMAPPMSGSYSLSGDQSVVSSGSRSISSRRSAGPPSMAYLGVDDSKNAKSSRVNMYSARSRSRSAERRGVRGETIGVGKGRRGKRDEIPNDIAIHCEFDEELEEERSEHQDDDYSDDDASSSSQSFYEEGSDDDDVSESGDSLSDEDGGDDDGKGHRDRSRRSERDHSHRRHRSTSRSGRRDHRPRGRSVGERRRRHRSQSRERGQSRNRNKAESEQRAKLREQSIERMKQRMGNKIMQKEIGISKSAHGRPKRSSQPNRAMSMEGKSEHEKLEQKKKLAEIISRSSHERKSDVGSKKAGGEVAFRNRNRKSRGSRRVEEKKREGRKSDIFASLDREDEEVTMATGPLMRTMQKGFEDQRSANARPLMIGRSKTVY